MTETSPDVPDCPWDDETFFASTRYTDLFREQCPKHMCSLVDCPTVGDV